MCCSEKKRNGRDGQKPAAVPIWAVLSQKINKKTEKPISSVQRAVKKALEEPDNNPSERPRT
jgi:hypothetical protein